MTLHLLISNLNVSQQKAFDEDWILLLVNLRVNLVLPYPPSLLHVFFSPMFFLRGPGGEKLWNHSTYFVTKDAKLCKLITFKCTLMFFFFFFFCYFLHHKIFCCCSACSAWSVIFKPLSYLIFIQHSYCKIVCEQCKWGWGGGGKRCRAECWRRQREK